MLLADALIVHLCVLPFLKTGLALSVTVLPGARRRVRLSALNCDGHVISHPFTFSATISCLGGSALTTSS